MSAKDIGSNGGCEVTLCGGESGTSSLADETLGDAGRVILAVLSGSDPPDEGELG